MKIVVRILALFTLVFLGYDIWYLFYGESGKHIPFLLPFVLGTMTLMLNWSRSLPDSSNDSRTHRP